jgi:hypothetical protein
MRRLEHNGILTTVPISICCGNCDETSILCRFLYDGLAPRNAPSLLIHAGMGLQSSLVYAVLISAAARQNYRDRDYDF